MSDPQTHIVYQNRVQYDFYESSMMIPLIGGLGVGFLMFLALMWLASKASSSWSGPSNIVTGAAAVVSLLPGAMAFHWMML